MVGVIIRAIALGKAAGMRSTLGFNAPGLFGGKPGGPRIRTAARALSVGGELVVDKLPQTPSRLTPPGLIARFASGAAGGFALARRSGVSPVLPVLAGVAGSAAGAWGGAAWRAWASERMPDWRCAIVEDGVALGLAYGACRTR